MHNDPRADAAREELEEIGFTVTLDDGTLCVARMSDVSGKLKVVTGRTILQVRDDAVSWWNWNQNNALEECRFRPGPTEVIARQVGDTATTAARRAEVARRQIGFDRGAPEIVAEMR
jgi:hypothetical protein